MSGEIGSIYTVIPGQLERCSTQVVASSLLMVYYIYYINFTVRIA